MLKKVNIILDLDQTLIAAEATEEYDHTKYKEKAKKFEFKNMDDYYIVFERPQLQKFLDYLFANFNVSIWTAASKDYALFIIEKIILKGKSERHLDWIFFSYHCDLSKRVKKGSKDLSMLWDKYGLEGYNKYNTLIIDDYNEVHKTQPGNCVIAIPFEFFNEGSEHDDYLNRLKDELTKMSNFKVNKNKNNPAIEINKALGTIPNSPKKTK